MAACIPIISQAVLLWALFNLSKPYFFIMTTGLKIIPTAKSSMSLKQDNPHKTLSPVTFSVWSITVIYYLD